jgi:acetyl-CoA synthetase
MVQADAVLARFGGHEDPAAQDALWRELASTVLAADVPFGDHWRLYQSVFADRPASAGPPHAWTPPDDVVAASNLEALRNDVALPDYDALHRWSAQHRGGFWQRVIDRLHIPFIRPPRTVLDERHGAEFAQWLPGARLNIAAACWQAPPEKTAIVEGHERIEGVRLWTYADVHALADRVSHGLRRLGLSPGRSVALYMPMTAECVAAYLGVVQAGLVVVSIADSFPPDEVATRLRLGAAQLVITVDALHRGKAIPLYEKARDACDSLGRDVRCVVVGDVPRGLRERDIVWEEFLGPDAGEPWEPVMMSPDDVSNVLFSSGTTGEPKAIPWSHTTPIKCAMDGHLHQDIHARDVVAWPTNIGWMMGPWLIYATFVNGATMALWDGAPTTRAAVEFLREARVSVLGVVPAIVRAWRAADIPPHTLPDVRVWSSTGEASNAEDYLYLMSLAGYRAPVIEYCGGTEIGGGHITGTVVQPASPATFTTPALGLDFVVLDDAKRLVAPGGHGQIYLVPPSIGLSQRLLHRDHHAEYYERCPTGPAGQTMRRHGDEVHVLHGGFWAAGGRADDTMNLAGIKVSSVELEAAMNGHPAVSETAAVAVPPPGGGADRLVVFVVTDGTHADADLRTTLQERIRSRLNPLFRIHDVVVVPALPRTASNKVMRRELRKKYRS